MNSDLIILKKGMFNEVVGEWQSFLRGMNLYYGKIDNDFGDITETATINFQKKYRLKPYDGVVGKLTYGKAIMLGFDICLFDEENEYFPEKPDFKPLVGASAREKIFGKFDYKAAPTNRNPEKIIITSKDWVKDNIVMVDLPALSEATNGKYTRMRWHKLGEKQLVGFFDEIHKKNLHKKIISYSGAFYPRFIRGSRTTLSNHSWGTAFDINASQNWLNKKPASIGEKGCLLELVPIAHKYGFYWGGHFNRMDGMHFELAKII